jgi:lipopolysaccharide/colanic/teichoic acid biosynthesis glycosyltransferase
MMDLGGSATMRTTRAHTRRHRSGITGDWQVVGDEIREAAKRIAADRERRGQTAK